MPHDRATAVLLRMAISKIVLISRVERFVRAFPAMTKLLQVRPQKEILFDFYNAMELLPAPPFVSTTMATP